MQDHPWTTSGPCTVLSLLLALTDAEFCIYLFTVPPLGTLESQGIVFDIKLLISVFEMFFKWASPQTPQPGLRVLPASKYCESDLLSH